MKLFNANSVLVFFLSFAFLVAASCGSAEDTWKNESPSMDESDTGLFKINWSKNIETMALIYNLSDAGDLLFELNPEPRAMLARQLTKRYEAFKNHEAVLLLNQLLDEGFVDLYDIDLAVYMTELPEFKQYADFPEIYFDWDSLSRDEVQHRFDEFHAAVRDFYNETKLEAYFTGEGKSLYEKIMNEVNLVRPDEKYCYEMEKYYGVKHNGYNIVVSAFAFNGMGRSKMVSTNDGNFVYQLVTSNPEDESDTINLTDMNSFIVGYVNKDYFHELAIHEMAHQFFTDALRINEKNMDLVNSISFLFDDSLKTEMARQGYQDWETCFEEHLVRLGEIKIARILGDQLTAENLYNKYVFDKGFKYIPKMDTLFTTYENDRTTYPTISDFIPKLVEEFKN